MSQLSRVVGTDYRGIIPDIAVDRDPTESTYYEDFFKNHKRGQMQKY